MGKPYTYTRIFKPLQTYDYRFWKLLEKNILNYGEVIKNNPIPESKFSMGYWYWPFESKPCKNLYNIIIKIAKLTGVKIMWKLGINETLDKEFQYLVVIGENTKVIICIHIVDYTIGGIFRFEDYLRNTERGKAKLSGYPSIIPYIRLKIWNRVKHIEYVIDYFIEEDEKKIRRLENYIMGQYKLDYKKYGQNTNSYTNALSTYFYPKRMML